MDTKYSMLILGDSINIISSINDGNTWTSVCVCDDVTVARVIVDTLNGQSSNLHTECNYEIFTTRQELSVVTEIAIDASLILKPHMSTSAPIDRNKAGVFLNRLEEFLQRPSRI